MSKLNVVFMGTPDFAVACLEMLITEEYTVSCVITQPDRPKGRGQKLAPSPVKQSAIQAGLEVLTPQRIKEPDFIERMRNLKPDIIVVVAFGQFLPQELLELPRYGCVNVHASLLPEYRGAAPIHWAIINGEELTGVTTMYMDRGMDTGDMIHKASVTIGSNETTGELHDKLKELGARVLSRTLSEIAAGKAPRVTQNHALASYASLLTRETEKINWQEPAEVIHNKVRGLNPWPGAYCLLSGKTLKLWKTKVTDDTVQGIPGSVLIQNGKLEVQTGRGRIELLELQPESKKRMSVGEFIRGQALYSEILLQ